MPTIEQAQAWYQGADPIHGFDHVMRVYIISERLAVEEGADLEIVHAAALLHDVEGSAPDSETRGKHHQFSADFAGKALREEGWSENKIQAVQHCIRAHRFRSDGEHPETIEAKVLFDADKLDVLGAIGVARVVGYAAINRQPVYVEPSEKFLATGEKAPGEAHSAYHEYLFKLQKIKGRLYTDSAKLIAEERDTYLREFFERLGKEMQGEK